MNRQTNLYKAAALRNAAAQIIRHCNSDGFDPDRGTRTAYLRDEPFYEDAGKMLASRGFGTLARSTMAGRGNVFTLRVSA